MGKRFGNHIVFTGWDGGEYGLLDPADAGLRDKQMFTGVNVVRYKTGLLGPRPGLTPIDFDDNEASGQIKGMDAFITGGSDTQFWVMNGTSVRAYNASAGTVSSPYSGPAISASAPLARGGSYGFGTLLNTSSQIVNLNHITETVSNVSTLANGHGPIGSYMTRFVSRGGSNRMYFSEPGPAWTTWNPTSYVDIGPALPHTFYTPFRDSLLVGVAGTTWIAVSGVLGATTTVRTLSTGGCPATPLRGVAVDDDMIWYFGRGTDKPTSFNGAIHERWHHLTGWSGLEPPVRDISVTPAINCASMPWVGTNDWLAISRTSKALIYMNGVFTKHVFENGVDAWIAPYQEFLIVGKDSGTQNRFFFFAPGMLDRPASSAYSELVSEGDGSSTPFSECWFETPEWWADTAHEVRVQKIIVDYVAWDTESSVNNKLKTRLTCIRRGGTIDTATSIEHTILDQPPSAFSSSGTSGRAECLIGDQGYGGGLRVKVSIVGGVAVRSIVVVLAEEARRP